MEKLVVGILAHVDAGKTTLSEGILYLTGKIRKLGQRTRHREQDQRKIALGQYGQSSAYDAAQVL